MRGKYRDMLEETLRKQQLEGKPSDKTQKILNLLLTAPADVTQKTLVFLTKVEVRRFTVKCQEAKVC